MSSFVSRLKALSYGLPYLTRNFFFQSSEVPFPEQSYPDITGQVWIVTGASAGIGRLVAAALAKQGAKVWLAARNEDQLKKAISDITANQADAKLDYFLIDLSDLTTIKGGIQKFLDSGDSLNGVVHNAGVMFPPQGSKSKQGYEMQLSTNNLGPHLLQQFLDPVLIKTADNGGPTGRLVWVSSAAHLLSIFPGGLNFNDLSDTGPRTNDGYATSKAFNVIESIQWTINHPEANVTSLSLHPGILTTELSRHIRSMDKILQYGSWDPIYGARTELYAALSPEFTTTTNVNAYIEPWGKIGAARPDIVDAAHDARRGNLAWKWENEQVKKFL